MSVLLYAGQALLDTVNAEHDEVRRARRWNRELRSIEREEREQYSPKRLDALRREFVRALDAAQAAGVTVDAWMSGRSRAREGAIDPALNDRADWAGLNDAA